MEAIFPIEDINLQGYILKLIEILKLELSNKMSIISLIVENNTHTGIEAILLKETALLNSNVKMQIRQAYTAFNRNHYAKANLRLQKHR